MECIPYVMVQGVVVVNTSLTLAAPPIHRTVPIPRTAGHDTPQLVLSLLGAFRLTEDAVPLALPGGAQRLLAFIALQERPTTRAAVAGRLWPDGSILQANANLRSAIWRLEHITREAMEVNVLDLEISEGVLVDLRESKALAQRLILIDIEPSDEDMSAAAVAALSSDLLPDWYDDWVLMESENWQQLRLHALEALARKLASVERFAEAIAAARAAIKSDPLRESARTTLIRVHLAEGNQSEALSEFAAYRTYLAAELGLEPSPVLQSLMAPLLR